MPGTGPLFHPRLATALAARWTHRATIYVRDPAQPTATAFGLVARRDWPCTLAAEPRPSVEPGATAQHRPRLILAWPATETLPPGPCQIEVEGERYTIAADSAQRERAAGGRGLFGSAVVEAVAAGGGR